MAAKKRPGNSPVYRSEFREIGASFRRSVEILNQPIAEQLFLDACGRAARATKLAIDEGWLIGDAGLHWPDKAADSFTQERGFCYIWPTVVANLCIANKGAMPLNPFVASKDSDGEITTSPDDWPRRAERYARICDWLAVNAELNLNAENQKGNKRKVGRRNADRDAAWLEEFERDCHIWNNNITRFAESKYQDRPTMSKALDSARADRAKREKSKSK